MRDRYGSKLRIVYKSGKAISMPECQIPYRLVVEFVKRQPPRVIRLVSAAYMKKNTWTCQKG